jgi:hypothetical protein
MKATNIWTKKFGSDRRLIGIDAFFIKNAGRGRRSDIDPPFPPVGIFGKSSAHARPERRSGHPARVELMMCYGSHDAAPVFSHFLDHAPEGFLSLGMTANPDLCSLVRWHSRWQYSGHGQEARDHDDAHLGDLAHQGDAGRRDRMGRRTKARAGS